MKLLAASMILLADSCVWKVSSGGGQASGSQQGGTRVVIINTLLADETPGQVCDLDGDGHPDLLFADASLLAREEGWEVSGPMPPRPDLPTALVRCEDLDGNGEIDRIQVDGEEFWQGGLSHEPPE